MSCDEILASVTPSERQIKYQQLEFYAFVHFTVNTFTDKEWGDGNESPSVFNPTKLDPEQWVLAVKSAGMKGLILTCKHHDGFCLWKSAYTEHCVTNSPCKEDVVALTAQACKKHGIKFGVYLSPWDRNCPLYGQGKAYDDYYVNQLTELLTNYGEIFSVWFDGACGEGKNGKTQVYDWERYYETIRRLQPSACIAVCGPDIRWCGNEAGICRESEWSVVPLRTRDTERIKDNSQKTDDSGAALREIKATDADLGSRKALEGEKDLIWYPAEVDTSIRPGWFWHESQNNEVKSLEKLISIYESSVGGNAMLLLNIPPTNEGLFHENDVKRLAELGDYITKTYSDNLAEKARITTGEDEVTSLCRDDGYTSFVTGYDFTLEWEEEVTISKLVLKECITFGQRVEKFTVSALAGNGLTPVCNGTVIGYKKITDLGGIKTRKLKITVADSRTAPILSFIGVYK